MSPSSYRYLSFLLLPYCLLGQSPELMIRSVTFREIPNEEVERAHRWIESYPGNPFSQDQWNRDLKNLASHYDKVQTRFIYDDDGGINIEISLQIRPMVSKVRFVGQKHSSFNTLMKEASSLVHRALDWEALDRTLYQLRHHYLRQGFFEVELYYTLDTHDKGTCLTFHIHEGRKGYLSKISCEGLSQNKWNQLRRSLHLQAYSFLTSWHTGKGSYIEDLAEADRLTLLQALRAEGYLDARVEYAHEELLKHSIHRKQTTYNGLHLKWKIELGQPYTLRRVVLTGIPSDKLEFITAFLALRQEPLTEKLIPLKPAELDQKLHKLYQHYANEGWDIQLHSEKIWIDPQSRIYDLSITVVEGRVYRLGQVHVRGNHKTKPRLILNSLAIFPGEILTPDKIRQTKQKIESLGTFSNVKLKLINSQPLGFPSEETFRDLVVEVQEEKSFKKAHLAVTAGDNDGFLDGLKGSMGFTMSNFYLGGLLNLASQGLPGLEGNGESLMISFEQGTHGQDFKVAWRYPYLFDTRWWLNVEIGKYREESFKYRPYNSNVHKVLMALSYPVTPQLTLNLTQEAGFESVVVSDEDAADPQAQLGSERGRYASESIGYTYRTLPSPTTTRSNLNLGWLSNSTLTFRQGERHFLSMTSSHSYQWLPPLSFFAEGTLKAHLKYDLIHAIDHTGDPCLPLNHRLFLGGVESIRGYHWGCLGEKDQANHVLGGLQRIIFGLEYSYPLNSFVDLKFFSDNGALGQKIDHLGRCYHSIGAGVSIKAMVPIMVGWAQPLTQRHDRSITKRFFITIDTL